MLSKKTRLQIALKRLLIVMPWYMSFLLGEASFIACKWILPAMCTTSVYREPGADAFSDLAWLLASLFLLMGVFILAARKKQGWTNCMPLTRQARACR